MDIILSRPVTLCTVTEKSYALHLRYWSDVPIHSSKQVFQPTKLLRQNGNNWFFHWPCHFMKQKRRQCICNIRVLSIICLFLYMFEVGWTVAMQHANKCLITSKDEATNYITDLCTQYNQRPHLHVLLWCYSESAWCHWCCWDVVRPFMAW